MPTPQRPALAAVGTEHSLRASGPDAGSAAFVRSLGGQLGSQALLALVGLAALPFLARNLGPTHYGHFSLAIAILGLTSGLDLVRPRFVRDFARDAWDARELSTLWTVDLLLVAGVATLVAALGLGAAAAAPIGLGALCFACASRDYALLAAKGRVGTATAIRNVGWAAATIGAVVVSGLRADGFAWLWCYPAANLAIWSAYRQVVHASGVNSARLPRPGWDSSAWTRVAADARDLLGHSASVLVLGSADKLMLERRAADPSTSGAYMGQYDLAVKVHVISTALGATLLPLLSRAIETDGEAAAARRFVRFATRTAVLYFLGLSLAIQFHEPIVRFVLGVDFASAAPLFAWMLPGVFLAHFGFVVTPWQRARGDFASQRRAYGTGAVVMLVVGVVAIPRFGASGAVATYLAARAAECLLLFGERRALPGELRPTVRLAGAALLACALFAQSWIATGGLTS